MAYDSEAIKKWEAREKLRYEHRQELVQRRNLSAPKTANYSKENPLDLPRHRVQGCASFQECPIDYKCIAYRSDSLQCQRCSLANSSDICFKKDIHNPKNFTMMISRERIELEDESSH